MQAVTITFLGSLWRVRTIAIVHALLLFSLRKVHAFHTHTANISPLCTSTNTLSLQTCVKDRDNYLQKPSMPQVYKFGAQNKCPTRGSLPRTSSTEEAGYYPILIATTLFPSGPSCRANPGVSGMPTIFVTAC